MRLPFQLWRYWVESSKGPVTEALLAKPETLEGLKPFAVLLRFKRFNDFGHYMTGEIRSYCPPSASIQLGPPPSGCRYVLRRVYVPLDAASYGKPNPLSQWTIAHFDAGALARHFRTSEIAPEANWWSMDRATLFAAAPSPRDVLTDNAKIIRLDSVQCPQMLAAIEALEGQPLGAPTDFMTIGNDSQIRPPPPHSVTTVYSVQLRADGGFYSVEGSAGPPRWLASPILAAADMCERAGRADN